MTVLQFVWFNEFSRFPPESRRFAPSGPLYSIQDFLVPQERRVDHRVTLVSVALRSRIGWRAPYHYVLMLACVDLHCILFMAVLRRLLFSVETERSIASM